jgi:hypothetical protein
LPNLVTLLSNDLSKWEGDEPVFHQSKDRSVGAGNDAANGGLLVAVPLSLGLFTRNTIFLSHGLLWVRESLLSHDVLLHFFPAKLGSIPILLRTTQSVRKNPFRENFSRIKS